MTIRLLLCLLCPFLLGAQQMEWDKFPNKSAITHLLHPIKESHNIDTSDTGFSNLQYHSFSSTGQFIKANHQQYFTDYLLFNINFDKFSHEGIYNREKLKLHNVQTQFVFRNKSKSYKAHLSLAYHKIRMDENGGHTNYAYGNFDDPLLYPVNLLSAENEAKNRNHTFAQNLKFADGWSVFNEFSILSNRKLYTDQAPNSGYYSDILLDSIQTKDSLSNRYIDNRFGLSYKDISISQLLHIRTASLHEIDSTDSDWGLGIDYHNNLNGLSFSSEFYQSSHLSLLLRKTISGNKFNHQLEGAYDRRRVPIFTNLFTSNHYRFNTDFSETKTLGIKYVLNHKKWSFSTIANRHTDFIYLNQSQEFQQAINPFLSLKNTFKFKWNWKRLHTEQKIVHQYSDNTNILRFPDFDYTASLWIESEMFGDNLKTKIGADFNYFTAYFAQAYKPALGQYHLQDEQYIGDVPLLSAFVNLKVQNMNIFLKYRNILALIPDYPNVHYWIPNYPSFPAILQLSIQWNLHND